MKATAIRLACLLITAFFVHCVMLNGVVLTKGPPLPGKHDTPSIVTIDICGHGAPSSAAGHLDLKAGFPPPPLVHFLFENSFPLSPDEAVASAPPGEIEKPPKAWIRGHAP